MHSPGRDGCCDLWLSFHIDGLTFFRQKSVMSRHVHGSPVAGSILLPPQGRDSLEVCQESVKKIEQN